MNSFYTVEELNHLGLKSVGKNVLLSRKASLYDVSNISIGNNVRIDDFCIISGYVVLGSNIHIAAYSALYGGTDGIFIADFANVSSRVSIYSVSDDYSGESMTNPTIPDEFKKVVSAPVHIDKHVVVGSTSVILPGVTLAEGGAFGAFSFINKSSKAWSIYAGIPCKKIKNRKKNIISIEKEYMDYLDCIR